MTLRHHNALDNYYINQAGHGFPVFVGGRNYRGRGIGNILAGIGRKLIPLIKAPLIAEGVRSGLNVGMDLLSGKNLTSSLKYQGAQAGKRLLGKAMRTVNKAFPPPPPPPRKRRIKPARRTRPAPKRRKTSPGKQKDIFG